MKRIKTPLRYFGGKARLSTKLLQYIPSHTTYVEPFAGSASLFFRKSPSDIEVINDLHSGISNLFAVIQDADMLKELNCHLKCTPYSREEFYSCRETWFRCTDPVEKARRYFVVLGMCFSGATNGGFSFSVKEVRRGVASRISKWLSSIDSLLQAHERLQDAKIEQKDFRSVIREYDSADTFFYLDPPYVHSTRQTPDTYELEMSDSDHEELLQILLKMHGKAILSGYANRLYAPLEKAGWVRIDFPTVCTAAGGRKTKNPRPPRIESIWISPNCQSGALNALD
jgi:DNA adenine methylase